jgi:hypothetical protein
VATQPACCGHFARCIGNSRESGVQRLPVPGESMQTMSVAPDERCAPGPRRTGHVRKDKRESTRGIGKHGARRALCKSGQVNHGVCSKWWGCGYELASKQGISFQALLQTLYRPRGKQKVRQSDRDMPPNIGLKDGDQSLRVQAQFAFILVAPRFLHRMDRMVRARIRHSIHRIGPLQGDYVFSRRRAAGGDK